MGHAGVDGGQAGDGAHDGGDDGRGAEEVHVDGGPHIAVGQVGAAEGLEAADGAAGGVEEADVGDAPFEGALVGAFFGAESVGAVAAAGAAADGEVAGGDDDAAAVDFAEALDCALGREADEVAGVVVGGSADEGHELLEGVGVEEGVDAFVDEELAASPLAGDALGSAAGLGECFAFGDFGDFWFPGHGGAPRIEMVCSKGRGEFWIRAFPCGGSAPEGRAPRTAEGSVLDAARYPRQARV